MSEEMVAVKEKKSCLFGCLFRLAVLAATVYGAVTAAKKVMSRLANRLEADNEGNEKKRYLSFLSGKTVAFDEEAVSDIEVYAVASGVELDLTDAELSEYTEVCVRAVLSGVVVKVPTMVRVEVEDTDVLSGFMNLVPNYEEEDLPVIHVKVQSLLSGVKVEMETV